jgi:hypothetical protein
MFAKDFTLALLIYLLSFSYEATRFGWFSALWGEFWQIWLVYVHLVIAETFRG